MTKNNRPDPTGVPYIGLAKKRFLNFRLRYFFLISIILIATIIVFLVDKWVGHLESVKSTAKFFKLSSQKTLDQLGIHANESATAASITAPVPEQPPILKAPTMGLVIVDVRSDGTIGSRLAPQVERLLHITDLEVEVWISHKAQSGHATTLPILSANRVHVRPMVYEYIHSLNITKKLDMQGTYGGYIGKAYALKESRFDVPILLDGDVWACDADTHNNKTGFVQHVKKHLLSENNDVLWTKAPYPFGGVGGRKNARAHVHPSIATMQDEYQKFGERNSGTIVAVQRIRRSVQQWLQLTLDIYVEHMTLESKFFITGNGKMTDQPAFREAFFVFREELQEYILDRKLGCRPVKNYNCHCACVCTSCLLIHQKEPFDACSKAFQETLKRDSQRS